MSGNVRVGGTWKTLTSVSTKVSGTWTKSLKGWVRISGTWVAWYQRAIKDTFTRANTGSGLGTSETGEAWTATQGNWNINSNTATSADTPNTYPVTSVDLQSADAIVQVSTDGNAGVGPAFWVSSAGSWWGVVSFYANDVPYTCGCGTCTDCLAGSTLTCADYSNTCTPSGCGSGCGVSLYGSYSNCVSGSTSNCTDSTNSCTPSGCGSGCGISSVPNTSSTCTGPPATPCFNTDGSGGTPSACTPTNGCGSSGCITYYSGSPKSGGAGNLSVSAGACGTVVVFTGPGQYAAVACCTSSATLVSSTTYTRSCNTGGTTYTRQCNSGSAYSCGCSFCYSQSEKLQILKSVSGTVSVAATSTDLGTTIRGIQVSVVGTSITAKGYSDTGLTTQIGSTLTYSPTSPTTATKHGIVKAPSTLSQGSIVDNFIAQVP